MRKLTKFLFLIPICAFTVFNVLSVSNLTLADSITAYTMTSNVAFREFIVNGTYSDNNDGLYSFTEDSLSKQYDKRVDYLTDEQSFNFVINQSQGISEVGGISYNVSISTRTNNVARESSNYMYYNNSFSGISSDFVLERTTSYISELSGTSDNNYLIDDIQYMTFSPLTSLGGSNVALFSRLNIPGNYHNFGEYYFNLLENVNIIVGLKNTEQYAFAIPYKTFLVGRNVDFSSGFYLTRAMYFPNVNSSMTYNTHYNNGFIDHNVYAWDCYIYSNTLSDNNYGLCIAFPCSVKYAVSLCDINGNIDDWDLSIQNKFYNVSSYYYGNVDTDILQSYNSGRQFGYTEGYDSGYNDGYNYGNDSGYTIGYNQGIIDSTDYSFSTLFGSVLDAPVNTFKSILNFDILGINIAGLVTSLITISLIVVILVMVFKK